MKFSIIIPTYNRADFLSASISSVLNQTFVDFELIIVDDGSTDNTATLINSIPDSRIKYIYQENAERSVARNNGIRNANGEWICFLDSDDEYLANHLEVLNNYILHSQHIGMIVTANYIKVNNEIKKHPLIDNSAKNILKEIWEKFILMNSVCVHNSILKLNKFNEAFKAWEDTHLWLRIAAQYPLHQIKTYTCIQNIHENSSVKIGLKKVQFNEVVQYFDAIVDLKSYSFIKNKLTVTDINIYSDSKLRMYLYQARQNKQIIVAFKIWRKALKHNFSFYLISELPKIFLNKLNIGIHAR